MRATACLSVLDEARRLLWCAQLAVRTGDEAVGRKLMAEAATRCQARLLQLGVSLERWADWRLFERACGLRSTGGIAWAWRRPRLEVDTAIDSALSALDAMSITLEEAAGGWSHSADLADSLEDLLDQVWRCEREWDFDDRLQLAVDHRLSGNG